MAVTDTSTGESSQGPVVEQIIDHRWCSQLREGDNILEVNREKVNTYIPSDLEKVLRLCAKGILTNFTILRQVPQQPEVFGPDKAVVNSTLPCLRLLLTTTDVHCATTSCAINGLPLNT